MYHEGSPQVSGLDADVSIEAGVLYVVATPLGNLADLSRRAAEVLGAVDAIAAEDTRHSRILLQHYGIGARCVSLHEHNESARVPQLLERLHGGDAIALISDAGTPLISDPGYRLVRTAREAGIRVSPVPGPCALTAALSVSGLAADRFVFEGFLPARPAARRQRLRSLVQESRTLILYESSHRIAASLKDLNEVFGPARRAVIGRELTKRFETVRGDSLGKLCSWLTADKDQQKGEFVVLIEGAAPVEPPDDQAQTLLAVLLKEVSVKTAARLAAEITGQNRNRLYKLALELKED